MAKHINVLDSAPDTLVRALGWTLAAFEDPVGLDRPLWRDYSYWQGFVDHGVAVANGVWGMAARAGISWGYQDSTFPHNWKGAGDLVMYRTSYFVPYADQPILPQVDNWYRIHPEIDYLPRVIDLELSRGKSASFIADFMWGLSEIVLSRDGVRPWIYSRRLLMNAWLADWSDDLLNQHYYILAQYLWDRTREHPGPPTLPNRVKRENVIMHQTADKKGSFPGETPGSFAADYDRWELGDAQNMHSWLREKYGTVEKPDPEEVIIPIRIAEVTAAVLNLRAGPGGPSEYQDIGDLLRSSKVPVIKQDGDWLLIKGWIHGGYTK